MTDSAAGNVIFIFLCFSLVFLLLFLFTFIKMKSLAKRIEKLEDAQTGLDNPSKSEETEE